jgi:hypothetical protein
MKKALFISAPCPEVPHLPLLQNGEQIQRDRQTRMFHNSVNFLLNQLKFWIWKQ